MQIKLFIILIIALIIPEMVFAPGMGGNGGMMSGNGYMSEIKEKTGKVRSVISRLRKEQGLNEGQSIDPDKSSPGLLSELGDAVMDDPEGNSREHEWMKKMLGGEGAKILESLNVQVGYRFILGLPIGTSGSYSNMIFFYESFYGNNPYIPELSLGSFLGMGTLMDISWILDYRFAEYLNLTRDEVKKITELKLFYEKETDQLNLQILNKRHQIFDLWSSENPDEEKIKNDDKEVLSLISAVSEKETEYRIKVLQILTQEQKKKMDYNNIMNFQNKNLK